MNQKQVVLKHLRKHKWLNSWRAFELYGISRLSAVIYDLRADGYNIGTVWEYATNDYGNQVRYVNYFLIKRKK